VAVKYFIEMCIDPTWEKRPSASQLRDHSLMADLEVLLLLSIHYSRPRFV
jgi:hypothetical protein